MPKRRPVQNNTTPSRRLRGGVTKPIAAQAQAQAQQGSRTHQTTMHQFGATGADGTADARKNTRKGGAAGAGAGTSGEQAIKVRQDTTQHNTTSLSLSRSISLERSVLIRRLILFFFFFFFFYFLMELSSLVLVRTHP